MLPTLPPELVLIIASHLPTRSLSALTQTAHHLHALLTPLLDTHALQPYAGLPPLHWAAKHSHLALLARLLPALPSQINSQPYSHSCATPLHFAAIAGSPHITAALLSAGASPHIRDTVGKTALHRACEATASEPVVRLLLAAGADVHARSVWGETPLHLAADFRHPGIVEMLLAAGAGARSVDYSAKSVLSYAVGDRAERALGFLLERSAARDARGLLVELRARRKRAIVETLLEAGAEWDAEVAREAVALREFGIYGLLLVKGRGSARATHRSPMRGRKGERELMPALSDYMHIY